MPAESKSLPVEKFDFSEYPECDGAGEIKFSHWTVLYRGSGGRAMWYDEKSGEMKPYPLTVSSSGRHYEMWVRPKNEDIRRVERDIFRQTKGGGKILDVVIGLWWWQDEAGEWHETKQNQQPKPSHWLSVWDKYCKKWRPEAFDGERDPWKDASASEGGVKGALIKEEMARRIGELSQTQKENVKPEDDKVNLLADKVDKLADTLAKLVGGGVPPTVSPTNDSPPSTSPTTEKRGPGRPKKAE